MSSGGVMVKHRYCRVQRGESFQSEVVTAAAQSGACWENESNRQQP